MDIKVLVPIAQGTEELEAITIINLMRRAGIQVSIAGENEIVTCARGLKILPDILLDRLDIDLHFDAIVIPGGEFGTINLTKNEYLEKVLKEHKRQDRLLAAICAGPGLLEHYKLIDNNAKLTSHPSVKYLFNDYLFTDEPITIDKNLITAKAAGVAFEFTLAVISKLCGDEIAKKVSNDIFYTTK